MNQWLLLIGEGSVVRQRESDFSVRPRLPGYPLTKGRNSVYYLIVYIAKKINYCFTNYCFTTIFTRKLGLLRRLKAAVTSLLVEQDE